MLGKGEKRIVFLNTAGSFSKANYYRLKPIVLDSGCKPP